MQHIISAKQFNKEWLERLYALAKDSEGLNASYIGGRIMITLFYEASTRTRILFEAAMLRLGGRVISTENAGEFSSAIKGESIEDTMRVLSGGAADVIVFRHPEEGSAERAAAASDVPVINAGDGIGEHPTQALLDMYTLKKELGRTDNLHVCVAGDLLNGRTVHSLIELLPLGENVSISLASPEVLALPDKYRDKLVEKDVLGDETFCLEDALRLKPDVLYMTRVQKERMGSQALYDEVKDAFVFDEAMLSLLGSGTRIMHPLPRVNEIDPKVDSDPRATYIRQAHNGLPVRIALLRMLLTSGK